MKIINDNIQFAQVVKYIGDRKSLNEEKLEGLEELTMDAAKAQEIITASKASMGEHIFLRGHQSLPRVGTEAYFLCRHGHFTHRLDQHRELCQSSDCSGRLPQEPDGVPAGAHEADCSQPLNLGGRASWSKAYLTCWQPYQFG